MITITDDDITPFGYLDQLQAIYESEDSERYSIMNVEEQEEEEDDTTDNMSIDEVRRSIVY